MLTSIIACSRVNVVLKLNSFRCCHNAAAFHVLQLIGTERHLNDTICLLRLAGIEIRNTFIHFAIVQLKFIVTDTLSAIECF